MFENIMRFFKKLVKSDEDIKTKDKAKERLHLVLMQDRANVSAEFLALMKQEIIEVIKKYIEVDEGQIDVKLTNQEKDDGTTGAPVLYANIPIIAMKELPKQQESEPVGNDAPVIPETEPIDNDALVVPKSEPVGNDALVVPKTEPIDNDALVIPETEPVGNDVLVVPESESEENNEE